MENVGVVTELDALACHTCRTPTCRLSRALSWTITLSRTVLLPLDHRQPAVGEFLFSRGRKCVTWGTAIERHHTASRTPVMKETRFTDSRVTSTLPSFGDEGVEQRERGRLLGATKILADIRHGTRMYTRIFAAGASARACARIRASVYVCVCVRARVCMNFSRSQDAHARGHGRHTSALGETLRPDPRSFLSPRFSVPRHPFVAQARTAFRISEGRATRTRKGALPSGWWEQPGDSAGGGRGGRSAGCE